MPTKIGETLRELAISRFKNIWSETNYFSIDINEFTECLKIIEKSQEIETLDEILSILATLYIIGKYKSLDDFLKVYPQKNYENYNILDLNTLYTLLY